MLTFQTTGLSFIDVVPTHRKQPIAAQQSGDIYWERFAHRLVSVADDAGVLANQTELPTKPAIASHPPSHPRVAMLIYTPTAAARSAPQSVRYTRCRCCWTGAVLRNSKFTQSTVATTGHQRGFVAATHGKRGSFQSSMPRAVGGAGQS